MTDRINKWDNIKAILILLVVFGHAISSFINMGMLPKSLYILLYSFHMPLFLFVSGLFSKSTVDKKKNDKLVGFILIHIILKAALSVTRYIYFGNFKFFLLSEKNFPWYMLVIALYPLIIRTIKKVKPTYVLTISILLSLLVGFDESFGDFLCISRLIVFFPFYYLGYILKSDDILKLTHNKKLKVICFAVLIIFTAAVFILKDKCLFISPLLSGRNSYHALAVNIFWGPLLRLLTYAVAFLISFCVITLTPERSPKNILAFFGKRTLPIYCLHIFVLQIFIYAFGMSDFIKSLSQEYAMLILGLMSVIITVICSFKPFVKATDFILNLPGKMTKSE